MNVLYDHQAFSMQKFGGISRYFYELINHLDSDISYKLPIYFSNNFYIQNKDVSNHRCFFPSKDFKGKSKILGLINNYSINKWAKTSIDIVHPTYYEPYFLRKIKNTPFVLTVYDMIHEKYSNYFKKSDPAIVYKKTLCEKASKIIAISENTKKDLVELFNINPEKITVIYLGQSFDANLTNGMTLPEQYVLFTGQRAGYKNFNRFIEAYSKIAIKNDIELICTGRPFSEEELSLLRQLQIEKRVTHFLANDLQLAELYRRSRLFVFPSEYEGFGIPILEAFASGCPIALSQASSFPEIAGDAGLYFDPLSVDSIKDTMQKALRSDTLRRELVERGFSQLSKFSWKKMGEETSKLYKSI